MTPTAIHCLRVMRGYRNAKNAQMPYRTTIGSKTKIALKTQERWLQVCTPMIMSIAAQHRRDAQRFEQRLSRAAHGAGGTASSFNDNGCSTHGLTCVVSLMSRKIAATTVLRSIGSDVQQLSANQCLKPCGSFVTLAASSKYNAAQQEDTGQGR